MCSRGVRQGIRAFTSECWPPAVLFFVVPGPVTGRTYFPRTGSKAGAKRTEAELDHYAVVIGDTVIYELELPAC